MKYTIIGSSAAGLSALETIHNLDPQEDITLITADTKQPHSRILTSYVLGNMIEKENIYIRSSDYFKKHNVNLIAGERAIALSPTSHSIELSSGKKLNYQKLLIATGGHSYLPDYKGKNKAGVFTLRDIEDVNKIDNYLNTNNIQDCMMFGGGLVSLKAAEAFYHRGKNISVVIHSPQILSQMLDKQAADIVENYLRKKNFIFYKGESVKKITGKDRVESINLESGKKLSADLILVGKGTRPNIDFIKDDNIAHDKYGIKVNNRMETNVENVYAAGDVTVAPDFLTDSKKNYAIWPDAVWQGKIAASNMTNKKATYKGGLNLNSLKLFDLPIFAAGQVKVNPDNPDYNVYIKTNPSKGIYRKLVFANHRLKGVIAVKQVNDIGTLYNLIKKEVKIENRARKILKHGLNYVELIKDKVLLSSSSLL